jgi:hypothetical protein
MTVLIFLIGTLLGILAGGTVCVRYLRSEISADIGPQLRRMQQQFDTLEAAVNLALMTRYADLSAGALHTPVPARPSDRHAVIGMPTPQ